MLVTERIFWSQCKCIKLTVKKPTKIFLRKLKALELFYIDHLLICFGCDTKGVWSVNDTTTSTSSNESLKQDARRKLLPWYITLKYFRPVSQELAHTPNPNIRKSFKLLLRVLTRIHIVLLSVCSVRYFTSMFS